MKILKWAAGFVRVAWAKMRLGKRLSLSYGGKPVYLGRGVRLIVEKDGSLVLGRGCYIDDFSRLQVKGGAVLSLGEGVYMNTNCRIVAAEFIDVGANTMFGPNVCVFDHDHAFDDNGVRRDLVVSPVRIGERCWIAANSLVTRGVAIADRILIGGGALLRALWWCRACMRAFPPGLSAARILG